jgi:competence protein ComEA
LKKLLAELWTEHRREFLFSVGMACFLVTGLLAWALPKNSEPLSASASAPTPVPAQAERTEKTVPAVSPAPQNNTPPKFESGEEENIESEPDEKKADERRQDDRWFLYITGSVRNPGVYQLPPDARLVHLIEAAGGMNSLADPVAVNLAAPLEDGIHVHIPKKGERTSEQTTILEVPLLPSAVPGRQPEPRGLRAAESRGNQTSSSAVIDVNRATEGELTALKGIGPVLAKNIVEYRRKNGPFKNIEELTRVKGIGLKKLEGFRDRAVARP